MSRGTVVINLLCDIHVEWSNVLNPLSELDQRCGVHLVIVQSAVVKYHVALKNCLQHEATRL